MQLPLFLTLATAKTVLNANNWHGTLKKGAVFTAPFFYENTTSIARSVTLATA